MAGIDERREPTWSGARRPGSGGGPGPGAGPNAAGEPARSPLGRASGSGAGPGPAAMRAEPPLRERLLDEDAPELPPSTRARTDATTRRLAIGAASLAGVLVLLVGGWSLFGHHHGGGVPVISPPAGPVRVKPLNPGGMQIQALPSVGTDPDGKATLAPAPEQPRPQALQQEVDAARREAAPPLAPEAPLKPAPEVTPKPAPDEQTLAPVAAPAPQRPATPASAHHAEAQQPAPAEPTPDAAPAAAPKTGGFAPVSGGKSVQLGALDSAQAAQAEWRRLSAHAPDLFAGHAPAVEQASRDGKSFWRLRTGGFASIAQASEFCVKVREAGGACTLASF